MGVQLYSSRVILDKLGTTDYALYYVVFGVIGLLSFLNGTLSSGTSRFITFELGKGNPERLKTTFSTTLISHLLLAGIILLLGETIGLWYAHNIMVVPQGRMEAAMIVYQISILSTIISILQVPFTSEIMAHEEMNVYAYLGIYEAIAKLAVVVLIIHTSFDKLIYFATLQCVVVFTVFLFYVWYSKKHFQEVTFKLYFDKGIFKSILKFSGWNIMATLSNTLMSQGVIMLFNLFFAPVVVAAQAISNQISNALMQFVNNVRQAVNPQVIKLYADEQYEASQRLTFASAEYIFDLLLLLGVPCIMVMPSLLDLWLVDVPEYAVVFAQLIIVQDILGNFSAAFYTPMLAANKISKNSIVSVFLCLIQFALLWVLFSCGLGPLWARYLALFSCVIFSFVVKPYILWHDVNYNLKDIYNCIWQCLKNLLTIVVVCASIYILIPQTTLMRSVCVALLSVVVVIASAYAYMNTAIRKSIIDFLMSRFKRVK
ncbi:MAG: hypothetical protein IKV18_02745 [Alistipes sp.]|nr:hypothetical protein [Alistipes sp.]